MFTILLYHGIDSGEVWDRKLDATDREYVLGRERFEQHIAYLARHRIPVSSLDACLRGGDDRAVPIVLTFDDGGSAPTSSSSPSGSIGPDS